MERLFPALVLLAATSLPAQVSIATNTPAGKPLSERVVAYNIDAKIDPVKHTVDGTEILTYRNLTGQPLSTFPFHLYLNAFQPESTFSRENQSTGSNREIEREYPPERIGEIKINSIAADGFGSLAPQFIAPDDGNSKDTTVMQISLPKPVAPGESITFRIGFHDKFPESIARNGYKRDFMMGGQWFPKVGVFWKGAWNCHQYHATTEFFADFGTFNVNLTLPQKYTVGASGVPIGSANNKDGSKTLSFYGEDIHDFAWAASPHFIETTDTYLSSLGPVRIRVLALASHPDAGPRYASITKQSMAKFDQWYGAYPYKQITVIDPEPDAAMEGMEYPTLFTADTDWYIPKWFRVPEVTVEHEFGHQYWYGMVATNEFEEAWLDEGINSYTEVKVMEAILGRDNGLAGGKYGNLSERGLQRYEYITIPDYDPLTRFAYKFRSANSYGGVTYGKTASALLTLEGLIGEDTMREALRSYFVKYRFTHPTADDFLRIVEQTAIAHGRLRHGEAHFATTGDAFDSHALVMGDSTVDVSPALRFFFHQAIYGTQLLDYAVDSLKVQPVQWWKPEPSNTKETDYVSTVILHRKDDFILPVTVEVIFDDGSKVRERWDGVDRWQTFTFTKRGVKIVSAEIDPDHIVLLDRDIFNNSMTRRRSSIATRKLTTLVVFLQQCLSQFATWIV